MLDTKRTIRRKRGHSVRSCALYSREKESFKIKCLFFVTSDIIVIPRFHSSVLLGKLYERKSGDERYKSQPWDTAL